MREERDDTEWVREEHFCVSEVYRERVKHVLEMTFVV